MIIKLKQGHNNTIFLAVDDDEMIGIVDILTSKIDVVNERYLSGTGSVFVFDEMEITILGNKTIMSQEIFDEKQAEVEVENK